MLRDQTSNDQTRQAKNYGTEIIHRASLTGEISTDFAGCHSKTQIKEYSDYNSSWNIRGGMEKEKIDEGSQGLDKENWE